VSVRKKPELNEALTDAVREFGRPTTPEQLEKRGVRRLRSISIDQVSLMIEKAVNRTIMERTLGKTTEDLKALVEQTQLGLVGLFKGVEEFEASRGALRESRAELLSELAEMRRERGRETTIPIADVTDPTVQKMLAAIRDTFARLGPSTPETASIQSAFAERALVLLEEARRRAIAAHVRTRDAHIDRLERRVTKLVQSLDATEEILKRVSSMKDVDMGLASLYRAVQGLSVEDPFLDRKREMMQVIFESNLELQKRSTLLS